MERPGTAVEPDAPEHQTSALPAVVMLPGDGSSEPFLLEPSDLLHGVPPGGAVLVVTRVPTPAPGSSWDRRTP